MIKLNQKLSVIRDEWNALKPREKKALIENDPMRAEKIRNKLYQGGYTKEGKEIVSLTNKMFGLSGQELRQANTSQHEYLVENITRAKEKRWMEKIKKQREEKLPQIQIKNAEKKLKKILKDMDLKLDAKRLMTYGIPNASLMAMGKEEYINLRKQMNEIAGKGRLKPKELMADIEEQWQKAMDEITKVNKTKDYGIVIKVNAVDYIKNFMEYRYFLNAPNHNQEQRIINAYLEYLDPHQLYEIESVLTDSTFKQQWDSDEDADTFDEDFNTKRQERLIKILRNETKKSITLNPANPHGPLVIDEWQPVGTHWTLQNFA